MKKAAALAIPALLLHLSVAQAQLAKPNIAQRDALVDRFERCAYVASMNKGEPNMAAEIAFVACKTEEDALRTWLILNLVTPAHAEAFIVRQKLRMKQAIVEIEKDMQKAR